VASREGGAGELSPAPREEELDPEHTPAITGRFSRALAVASTVLLFGILATVLLQVVMRYVFNSPLTWTDEVTRLQLVWLAFVGAVLAYRLGKDIAVDAVEQFAKKRHVTWLAGSAAAVIETTVLLVALTFTVAGWQLAVATVDRVTPALGIPVATFYAVVPLAGVLLLVSVAQRLWAVRRSGGTDV
jgi:TRAP-type C4-dicarboxylate transport system permease small subunit